MSQPYSSPRLSSPPHTHPPSIAISLFSYGHKHGPLLASEYGGACTQLLAYNIRHLPNPPRKLRAMMTGLSPRLQKEFLKINAVEDLLDKVLCDVIGVVRNVLVTDNHHHNHQQSSSRSGDDDDEQQTDRVSLFEKDAGGIGGDRTELVGSYDCSNDPPVPDSNFDLRASAAATAEEEEGGDGRGLGLVSAVRSPPCVLLVVAVCCEEGRHRSVAFVEEIARRLAGFKNGDGESCTWRMRVSVLHREIIGGDSGLTVHSREGELETVEELVASNGRAEGGRGKKKKAGGRRKLRDDSRITLDPWEDGSS